VRDVLYPLLGLTDMTEVLVRLEKLALLIHPVPAFPAVAGCLGASRVVGLVCALEATPATEADDFLRGRGDGEIIGGFGIRKA